MANAVEHQKFKTEDEQNKWKQSLNEVNSVNVCNRLYTLGKRRQELKEFHIKQKQQEMEEEETRSLKFKPNLALTNGKNTKILKERKDKG